MRHTLLLTLLLLCGCASARYEMKSADKVPMKSVDTSSRGRMENILDGFSTALGPETIKLARKVIRNGRIKVEVDEVETAADAVEAMTVELDGYVESRNSSERRGRLTIRVPAEKLEETLDRLAALGEELSRSIDTRDVTGAIADLAARLKTNKALRDRLRELLEMAKTVKDRLELEAQLTRLQAEIDVQEGRLRRLRDAVRLSTITVRLQRAQIDGPLTVMGKGVWWVCEKLFVFRR